MRSTIGMRVEPPTSSRRLILLQVILASASTCRWYAPSIKQIGRQSLETLARDVHDRRTAGMVDADLRMSASAERMFGIDHFMP